MPLQLCNDNSDCYSGAGGDNVSPMQWGYLGWPKRGSKGLGRFLRVVGSHGVRRSSTAHGGIR